MSTNFDKLLAEERHTIKVITFPKDIIYSVLHELSN